MFLVVQNKNQIYIVVKHNTMHDKVKNIYKSDIVLKLDMVFLIWKTVDKILSTQLRDKIVQTPSTFGRSNTKVA